MPAAATLRGLERQLLRHVARYRLTVPQAVRQLWPRPFPTRRAAERLLAGLVQAGLLGTAPLYGRRPYHFLTERAERSLAPRDQGPAPDVPSGRSGALAELAKVRAYAFLAFCCLSGKPRTRLTAADFQSRFPALYRPGLAMSYYLDAVPSGPRLGFLRIDTGGPGRWDRVLDRFCHDLHEHALHPGFRRLIDTGQFEMTLVTALPQKALRLSQALAHKAAVPLVPVGITAIPDLLYLIASPAS